MMPKIIIVTVEIEIPDQAADKDISDWVDVEYGQCGSRKLDNPCRGDVTEVINHSWKFES
ncbi:hypothetical protein [Enterobacter cloacae]|uniref:hypothetical protein n=2 Tax=Enterobacter cloacae TaxID=550 RepID=UPI0020036942|nr:hypothetical protein [Enterobacter cloacae]MCK7380257.1 hypothetical protein [Enterobacter cloacae]